MDDLKRDILPPEPHSKVQRLSSQTKGLVEDLRTWVDLKMQFTQLDLEDRVDKKVNEAAKGAIVGAVALLTLVFVLVTAALGLGELLDSYFFGFLSVTGALLLILTIVALVKPKMVKVSFFDRSPGKAKASNKRIES
jgi:pheromone shutdown protein TraB